MANKNLPERLIVVPRYDYGYRSVRFHLKQQKNQGALTQIMLAVRINGRRYRLYTKCKVEPMFWDVSKGCCIVEEYLSPRVRTRMKKINDTLSKIKSSLDVADRIVSERNRYLTIEDMREIIAVSALNPETRNSRKPSKANDAPRTPFHILLSIAENFDSEISSKGVKGSASSRRTYLFCCRQLAGFIRDTSYDLSTFYRLDSAFYTQFAKWLNERTLASSCGQKKYCSSTVQISINGIKNLHHKAYLSGLTDVQDCRDIHMPITAEAQTSKIYLTEDELDRLRRCPIKSQSERKVLDMFILASYTGLRISDINRLNEAVIAHGTISMYQKKTKGYVYIPILKEVSDIVQEYSTKGFPKLNQSSTNLTLKKLCREAGIVELVPVRECRGGQVIVRNLPKSDLVSFHTARRSCITNLFRRGYSPNYLMTMSGHKSISSFQRYIKSSAQEISEDFIRELKKRNAI